MEQSFGLSHLLRLQSLCNFIWKLFIWNDLIEHDTRINQMDMKDERVCVNVLATMQQE